MSAIEQAQQLLAAGRASDAVAILEKDGERGNAASWLELGLLYLSGRVVKRDFGRARDCFHRGSLAGDVTARSIHIQLIALGVGGPVDWAGALDQLRDFGRENSMAARQIALLEEMNLAPDGSPADDFLNHELSGDPEVRSISGLFTGEECQYLIERALPALQPATVVDPVSGKLIEHPVRTSHNMAFPWVLEDLVIQALNRRIGQVSGTAALQGEPLQVLRYAPGQQYRPHFDAYDDADNQRVLTMLIYLNEGYEGGQTVFTHNGLTFRGRTGDGLLFRNATPSGQRDEHAQHASLPVTRGEKWLASRWIRERPLVAI